MVRMPRCFLVRDTPLGSFGYALEGFEAIEFLEALRLRMTEVKVD